MQFLAVYRQPNGGRRTPGNSDTQRHIIARFVCRKDKDLVWSQREAIRKTENYKDVFFAPDLVKELAEEASRGSSLCQKGIQFKCSYSTYTERRTASETAIEFALLSF